MVFIMNILYSETLKYYAHHYIPVYYRQHMPKIFTTGVIIPVIKKSTLDPNVKNYRPITI